MSMTNESCSLERNPFMSAAEPTLADVLARLQQDEDLRPTRRRDLCSAVRRLAKLLHREPVMLPARVSALRHGINDIHPVHAGVSEKTLQNIKSSVLAAFRHLGISSDTQDMASHLSPNWRSLFASLPEKTMRYGLSRFIRFCSAAAYEPRDVDDHVVDAFMVAVREATFVKNPDKLHRQVTRLWNRAVEAVDEWPSHSLRVPQSRKRRTSIPLSEFPAPFQKEVAAYLVWLEDSDPFANHRPPRRCRSSTIKERRTYISLAASALVHRGHALDRLSGLADLVEVNALKEICRYYLERKQGKPSEFLRCLTNALIQVAHHWLRMAEPSVSELRDVRRQLGSPSSGLTEKNRAMLRQFDDPATLGRLLALPAQLADEAVKRDNGNWRVAVKMQTALAIEILLMAPMRIGNLIRLQLDAHLVRSGGRKGPVHIVFTAEEMKNAEPIEYELPRHLTEMLDLYLERFRPRLAGPGNCHLFPGQKWPMKTPGRLRQQLAETIRRRTGIVITAHQFRHLAAKLVLDANPANFELARRVLGHKRMRTTTSFYAGLDARRAVRHYDENVLKLRRELCK